MTYHYDAFVRTTEPRHHRASDAIWKAMEEAGDLYLDRYEGWYSVRDEAFYDESELIEGEGGEKLSPQGTPVEWTAEETWFFRLSKYQEPLLDHYTATIPTSSARRAAATRCCASSRAGLKDLSVSRTSFDWGVPVPGSRRPCDVRLGRRADDLHDRRRLSRRSMANSSATGRPTSI